MPNGPSRAERQHHIGLGDQLHGSLGALIAERPCPQPVRGGEAVIVEIAVDDRSIELLGQPHAFIHAVGENDAAPRNDDREARLAKQVRGLLQTLLRPRPERHPARSRDLVIGLAIEIVVRNVELRRSALAHRHVEASARSSATRGCLPTCAWNW